MNTPFTPSDFLEVFARYNAATWLVTYILVTVGAWEVGMHEDWGVAIAAVVAAVWLLARPWGEKSAQPRGHSETAVSHRIWKHVSKT